MSADAYEDCLICNGVNKVRIDGLRDYDLHEDGSITTLLHGRCENCNTEFKVRK